MFINYAFEPFPKGVVYVHWNIWWDVAPFQPDGGQWHCNESIWLVPGTMDVRH